MFGSLGLVRPNAYYTPALSGFGWGGFGRPVFGVGFGGGFGWNRPNFGWGGNFGWNRPGFGWGGGWGGGRPGWGRVSRPSGNWAWTRPGGWAGVSR